MIIKMLLEEAGQFFYCEARKTAPHSFEGAVHFLHKVGDGNAFVRGNTHALSAKFECRNDALTAAERLGKQIANRLARPIAGDAVASDYCDGILSPGRQARALKEKAAR